ncbi:MAG: EMC3/TMCO1 family protein [Candidatus Hodarchaeales archaeon]
MFIISEVLIQMLASIQATTDLIESLVPTSPPWSSLFILVISFIVSLFSTLISRLMIDIDKLERLTKESKKYNKLKMQMLKTADTKLKLKYEKNADRMKKVQSELSMMKLKPIMITFIPLMIFFVVFSSFFQWQIDAANQITGNIPAVIPFELPEQIILAIGKNGYVEGWGRVFVPQYIWWYFGGSLTFGSILQKLAGLQPD